MTTFRLRPGVHVAPVEQGLSIVGRGQAFVIEGSSAKLGATWNALFPRLHLGGDHAVLVAGLEPATELLQILDEAGLLLTAERLDAGRFPRTVNYLETFADQPAVAWDRVRATAVRVSGTGTAAFAAARALLTLGFGSVGLDDAESAKRLHELADELDTELSDGGSADVVVSVDAEPPVSVSPWVGVLLAGEVCLIAPVSRPGCEDAELTDLITRRRLRTGETPVAAPTTPVAAALAGNLAALQVVGWCAGLAAEASLVESDTLQVRQFPIRRPGDFPLAERENRPHPAGTRAPVTYNYLPPADDWLLAVTDPATGLLDRPAPIAENAAAITAPSGARLIGYGSTAALAARSAVALAARELVPDREGAVAVSGFSAEQLRRDVVRRLLWQAWSDPVRRAALFTAVDGGTFEVAGTALWLAVAGSAMACSDNAETARALVAQHDSGATSDPIAADPADTWDPEPVLALLVADGTLAIRRWYVDPLVDTQLLLGWFTFTSGPQGVSA